MRPTIYGKWVISRPLKAYVLQPAFISLALMGLYFSHVLAMQSFVAPPEDDLGGAFLGGFGALSAVQTFILISALFFIVRGLLAARQWLPRIVLVLLLLLVVSIAMEELDFGASVLTLLFGPQGSETLYSVEADDFDPSRARAEQLAGLIKLGGSSVVLVLFTLATVLLAVSRNRTAILLRPPLWILATVALTVVVTRLAFLLNGAGLGTIQGVQGALHDDLSEFGELNVYFLLLIYVAALHERIIARSDAWAPQRGVTRA